VIEAEAGHGDIDAARGERKVMEVGGDEPGVAGLRGDPTAGGGEQCRGEIGGDESRCRERAGQP
jgi:hypothetical protein